MAMMNMVQAINNALDLAMAEDGRVVLLGEDIGKDGGVFRVTDGLVDKYTKDRVIDTPLAESGIIGTSIGMAIARSSALFIAWTMFIIAIMPPIANNCYS